MTVHRRTLMQAAALGVGKALAGTSSVQAAPPLHAPVDVDARRRLRGRPLASFGCKAAPAPIRDLHVEDAYVDKAASVIDPAIYKRELEQVRGLSQYTYQLCQLSDIWLCSSPARPRVAQCTLAWLDAWAEAGGLLGKLDTAGAQHQRKWTLAGLSLAFLKIQGAPGLDPAALSRVRTWFAQLADASEAYYATWPASAHNNHFYWLALALAGTAVATNDAARLERAFAIYDEAVAAITPEGTLPLEIARRSRAFGYHVFSLVPLVFLAEIGVANGHDLYASRQGALHRLAHSVQAELTGSMMFERAAGTPQVFGEAGLVTPESISWGEPYYARFPNRQLGELIAPRRPIVYAWAGGNVTDSYGSPALPFPAL
jgi:poly(beta-D-mannuronate) lyase